MSDSLITLTEAVSGATAVIALDRGCNCFSLRLPHQEQPTELLWSEPGFPQGAGGAAHSGIPLLFPFPGRLASNRIVWQGEEFSVTTDPGELPIHGFVYDRPWRLLDRTDTTASAEFVLSRDGADGAACWPADFRLVARFALTAASLTIVVEIENVDCRPLPWGLGLHPYFRLAATASPEDAAACRVQLPVAQTWEMEGPFATGEFRELGNALSLHLGMRFSQIDLDLGFTGLQWFDETATCRLLDTTGRQVSIAWGPEFPHLVVYTPPHREAICLEPWTCLPDPLRLHEAGIASGLRLLAPGETIAATVTITQG
ncbi:aldose 1-epimerase [Lignipirellula cremea]|uniref:Aldose 1-epimerase n=1 Tax=Lignipirellula cremea TaxID=2528010 RepID=A0A518DQ99_9BACT|nr:aldose 1-epimerase [Lignipirellula cremea]QDU94010.1 Aldose 1-epimerase [Lignipirellula cremea]